MATNGKPMRIVSAEQRAAKEQIRKMHRFAMGGDGVVLNPKAGSAGPMSPRVPQTTAQLKKAQRAKLAADLERFMARGGKIDVRPVSEDQKNRKVGHGGGLGI